MYCPNCGTQCIEELCPKCDENKLVAIKKKNTLFKVLACIFGFCVFGSLAAGSASMFIFFGIPFGVCLFMFNKTNIFKKQPKLNVKQGRMLSAQQNPSPQIYTGSSNPQFFTGNTNPQVLMGNPVPQTFSGNPTPQIFTGNTDAQILNDTSMPQKDVVKPKPEFSEFEDGQRLKYHYNDVKICYFEASPISIDQISINEFVDCVPEETTVCVYYNSQQIGYFYDGKVQDMVRDFTDREEKVSAFIKQIDTENKIISLEMAFYKKVKPLFKGKLTGNKNEDMQINLIGVSGGDEITIDYNYEKEKYEVFIDGIVEIGYLPKSCNEKLEDAEEVKGYIHEIDYDDNGNYVVTVVIY